MLRASVQRQTHAHLAISFNHTQVVGLRSGVLFGHNAAETAAASQEMVSWLRDGGQPTDALSQAIKVLEGATGEAVASQPAEQRPGEPPAAADPGKRQEGATGDGDDGHEDGENSREPTEAGQSDKQEDPGE